jgi:hypothetical protein
MFMPVGWAWKTTLILCMPVWRADPYPHFTWKVENYRA